MNQKECVNQIFKEIMFSKPDHPLTIVCCFHSRKDMQNFVQLFYDKFRLNINVGIVSDYSSTTVLGNRIFFLHEDYQHIEGLNPDRLFFQKRLFCYSNLVDILKYKSSALKNSEIYSFE